MKLYCFRMKETSITYEEGWYDTLLSVDNACLNNKVVNQINPAMLIKKQAGFFYE